MDRWDPNDTSGFDGNEEDAVDESKKLAERLMQAQELLYAENKHSVLVVLQALDTGGKDGTIRRVFEGVNPQGVRVTSFKAPTPEVYVDGDEEKKRLQDRLDDPKKRWKFNPNDLTERKFWAEYMKAYEEALERTSTDWAPWYVVPSNHNWFRDLLVSRVLVRTLEKVRMKYPPVPKPSKPIVIK